MVYHVRDVLDSARPTPPPARISTDDIIARARRMRRQRRAAAAGAAAVVAIAAVGAGVSLRPTETVPAASFTPEKDAFSTVFGEYRVGADRIGPVTQVTSGYQELPVYRDGDTWEDDQGRKYPLTDGAVTFYQPGIFDPGTLGSEESGVTFGPAFAVTVGGKEGVGRMMTTVPDGSVRVALAWRYAPDAWAAYVPRPADRSSSVDEAIRIAEAIKPGRSHQIRVPYRMTFVPAGWQTVSAEENTTKYSNIVSETFLYAGPLPTSQLAKPVDIRLNGVEILVMRGKPKNGEIRGKDGLHCYPATASCTIVAGDYFIDVEGRFSGLPAETVRQIADGLKPVDFTDHDEWLPVGG
ncbi:hypothetical protein BJ973_003835 [Actinoplanes tereljensis]|uniref:Uncharacterized protein n=1 Tax=Paractinoplanes tereljensis TaxID=571912 RepID=A0A919NWD0_9ACTN|nr:hypothetical protein [Actinoplanes tereljensis]GIF25558.1 hypothetical protein Ate02nite_82880 [Actinoplanes tereljensis]